MGIGGVPLDSHDDVYHAGWTDISAAQDDLCCRGPIHPWSDCVGSLRSPPGGVWKIFGGSVLCVFFLFGPHVFLFLFFVLDLQTSKMKMERRSVWSVCFFDCHVSELGGVVKDGSWRTCTPYLMKDVISLLPPNDCHEWKETNERHPFAHVAKWKLTFISSLNQWCHWWRLESW